MKRTVLPLLLAGMFVFVVTHQALCREGAAEERGLAAPRGMLPEELQAVDIADHFIPIRARKAGVIKSVRGYAVVLHRETKEAYFAASGDRLYLHDVVTTLKDSRCRLKFTTRDLIAMGENTRIEVDEYVDNPRAGKKRSVLRMAWGKAMFYMLRLFKYRTARATINTPTAVLGIRGTKFGVEVRKVGEKPRAARPIQLAAAGDFGHLQLAAVDPAGWETIVYVFEGEVNVNGQKVGEGETWEEGVIQPTEPEDAEQFISDTEGGEEGGGEKGKGGEGGKGETGAGETDSTKEGGDKGSDQAEGQTSVDAEQQGQEQGLIGQGQQPANKYGYFSALLTEDPIKLIYWGGSYISTSPQPFSSAGCTVKGYDAASNVMQGTASIDGISYFTRVQSLDGDSGDLGTSVPVLTEVLGSNSYMEWGRWNTKRSFYMDTSRTLCGWVDNGYYIFGDVTTDAKMSDLASANVQATYTGDAYGTYWTSGGGKDMSGYFQADVDFLPGTITGFEVHVQEPVTGGVSATISDASGTLSGSQFSIDPSTGTWLVGGNDADQKAAYGSFYGPNADSMGGVWRMDISPNGSADAHAVGIFQGNKGGATTDREISRILN